MPAKPASRQGDAIAHGHIVQDSAPLLIGAASPPVPRQSDHRQVYAMPKILRRIVVLPGIVASMTVAIILILLSCETYITFTVTNNSGQYIKNLNVAFRGGVISLGELDIGEHKTTRIVPGTESHIEIDIFLADGTIEHRVVGGYFERGYTGNFEITLEKELTVHEVTYELNYHWIF